MYYPWLDLKFNGYPTGIPVKNYLPSDVVSLTYPLRYTAINLLKQHAFPFINLHILSGVPLLLKFSVCCHSALKYTFLFKF